MSQPSKIPAGADFPLLNETLRRELLALARKAIVETILRQKGRSVHEERDDFPLASGAFVTLNVRGRLRGCIGVTVSEDSLTGIVAHCAVAAATEDPRFTRLRHDELADLEIEISILSALNPIQPDEIEIGRHGLLVECGARRGLLLPKVAVEHRWTRERFLVETCEKAGLPPESWKLPHARLLAFTAEVFADSDTLALRLQSLTSGSS